MTYSEARSIVLEAAENWLNETVMYIAPAEPERERAWWDKQATEIREAIDTMRHYIG